MADKDLERFAKELAEKSRKGTTEAGQLAQTEQAAAPPPPPSGGGDGGDGGKKNGNGESGKPDEEKIIKRFAKVPPPMVPWRRWRWLSIIFILVFLSLALFTLWMKWYWLSLFLSGYTAFGISVVPQNTLIVVEFVGRYFGTFFQGIYFFFPGLMWIRRRRFLGDRDIRLRGGVYDDRDGQKRPPLILKDGGEVKFQATMWLRLNDRPEKEEDMPKDPAKATEALEKILLTSSYEDAYNVDSVTQGVIAIIDGDIRSRFAGMEFTKANETRDQIRNDIYELREHQFDDWGQRFLRIVFERFEPADPETLKNIQKVFTAQKEGEARVITAEAGRRANAITGEGEGERIRNAADRSGIRDPEVIVGREVALAQAAAIQEGNVTVILDQESGPISIPGATAKVERTLEALRKGGNKKTEGGGK